MLVIIHKFTPAWLTGYPLCWLYYSSGRITLIVEVNMLDCPEVAIWELSMANYKKMDYTEDGF